MITIVYSAILCKYMTWIVYDLLVFHMDGIENEIILQNFGAFLKFNIDEAVVLFVLEQ